VAAPLPKIVSPVQKLSPIAQPQTPIMILKKPRSKFNWRLFWDVAYFVCAAALIAWLAPQAYGDVLAYMQLWSSRFAVSATWKLVLMAVGSLFAAWLSKAL